MAEGELIVTKKGQVRVRFVNKNGKSVEAAVPQNELSRSIAAQLEEHLSKNTADKLTGLKVELEEVGGQPKKVRPVGEPFESPVAPMPTSNPGSQTKKSGAASSHSRQPQPAQHGAANQGGGGEQRFHNPYNFVPALPRDKVGGDLGDSKPAGHHVLFPDRYSGVIRVCMTAKTPLLVPDAGRLIDYQKENEAQGITKGHKSYPVRLDPTGKPYIPPTSVKGMLRAAYEAVTNSRLAVFPGHDRKLAYRMVTQEGLALVPARIDNNSIQLLPGTATIGANGPQGPMYAAWLPRYHNGQVARWGSTLSK
ncbi:MAG: hypothetical protein KatS3mg110_0508 [Pirellulaceae bacterium]|nr:MAG: hypothetical protein KatS3mg110_0508 [Pirellulaceae bacterium]